MLLTNPKSYYDDTFIGKVTPIRQDSQISPRMCVSFNFVVLKFQYIAKTFLENKDVNYETKNLQKQRK